MHALLVFWNCYALLLFAILFAGQLKHETCWLGTSSDISSCGWKDQEDWDARGCVRQEVLQKASRFSLPRCNQVSSLSCALWFPCKNLPLQHYTVEIVYMYLRLQILMGRAKCSIAYLFPLHMQMVPLSKFVSFWTWILIHIRSFQDKRIWSATSTSFCMACLGVERARSQWRLCDGCSRCKNPILKMSFY